MTKGERNINALKGALMVICIPIAIAACIGLAFGVIAGLGLLMVGYFWLASNYTWETIAATTAVFALAGAWVGYVSDDPIW